MRLFPIVAHKTTQKKTDEDLYEHFLSTKIDVRFNQGNLYRA